MGMKDNTILYAGEGGLSSGNEVEKVARGGSYGRAALSAAIALAKHAIGTRA